MPENQNDVSIRERTQQIRWLMRWPALTVMVLTRWDMGYRILNPGGLLIMFVILLFLCGASNPHDKPVALLVFSSAMLAAGLSQRIKRWLDMGKGGYQHSYYIGTSCLEHLAKSQWLRANRRASRLLEPVVVFLLGLAIAPFSEPLGGWLMFCGFAIRIFEDVVYQREFNQRMNLADGLIDAEVQGKHVEQVEKPAQQQSSLDDPGVPTGIGNDIRSRIKDNTS